MTKLDIQSKIDFDRSIGTEDRFNLRKWFEKLVTTLNQSNPQIWEEVLEEDLAIIGFTDLPMNRVQFVQYMESQFESGEYLVRYPFLKVLFDDGVFKFHGTFESFTDGVLACSGDIKLEVLKDDDLFKLKSEELSPRFRVQH